MKYFIVATENSKHKLKAISIEEAQQIVDKLISEEYMLYDITEEQYKNSTINHI